ncbi:hypothetical protein GS501_05505 [Saccharibacter sp. 17.LH.SD]|uniref:translocation/assembly module TamB domain-containing protein n=1 Tax=Saccharibacter sp. 17.LH.SD TaxID=2689393 RepID=UPI0013691E5F|nr:translocation/assembly module TamB domain-containing protein [Saccharibacter sp. 17.LH.SD]MXV44503.1 hypothetical protein [Saccharibacter sp. 17.LH.SD]
MRRLRRIALWTLAVLLGLPVVLVAVVLVAVNTTIGQRTIEEKLPGLTGGMVQVKGLSGVLPWHLALEHAALKDEKGVWLELDHADLQLSWSALFHKTVKIDHLRADRLNVIRMLVSAPKPTPEPQTKTKLWLPSLAIQLDQLDVKRIDVGESFIGHSVSVAVLGHAYLNDISPFGQGVTLNTLPALQLGVDVKRLDQPAHIVLNAHNGHRTIDATIHFDEGENGFVALLGHMPSLDPMAMDLTLHGPYQKINTAFSLQAGVAQTGQLNASLKGDVNLDQLTGALALQLTSSPMTLLPGIGWEAIHLATNLHGHLMVPQGTGTVDIKGLAASGAGAETIHLDFASDGEGAQSLPLQSQLVARIIGLRIPGKDPTLFAGAPLTLKAHIRPSDEHRPFDVALDHDLVHVLLKGGLSPAIAGHMSVVVPSFEALSGAIGTPLKGHTELNADFALPKASQDPITAALDGKIAFTGGQIQAVHLIGPQGHLVTHVTRLPNGQIQLDTLTLDGRALHVKGQGVLDPKQHLQTALSVTLPDLQQAEASLRGHAALSLEAQGALTDLQAQARLESVFGLKRGNVVVPTAPLTLVASVKHLPSHPEGKVDLTGMLDRAPLALQAQFVRDQAGNMGLDLANLSWKTLQGKGNLRLPAGQKIPKGDLDLAISHLEVFRSLIGQPIAGHVALSVHTVQMAGQKGQNAQPEQDTLNLGLNGHVTMADYAVQDMNLKGSVTHLPNDPTANLTMVIKGIKAKGITGAVQGQIKGPQNALALALKGRFEHVLGAPASFDLAALEDVPGQRVQISKLLAEAKSEHVQLLAPAKIQYGSPMAVDRLRLSVRAPHGVPALLDVAGKIKPDLALTLKLDQLTPALAEPFAPSIKADGTISAVANVRGTLAAPTGTITLNGAGLHMRNGPADSLEPASFQVKTTLQGKTAQLQAHMAAGRELLFTLQGSAPLQPTGPLNLTTNGKADLAFANAILGAYGMGVGGQLSLDMGVKGTLKQPRLSGKIQLRGGSFDHYAQGVHLTDIKGDITANGDSISIDQLLIHAGKGTMSLVGNVGVLHPGLPVDLKFAMDQAQPLRNDMIEETIDSQLHIYGQAIARMDVAGWVKIPQASITIPDSMPASVPQLDVVTPQTEAEKASASSLLIGLNIDVKIPSELFVRGHGLFAEMQGRLHVGGTSKVPVISGGIDLRRGSFNLGGINLNFTQGHVGFDGVGVTHKLDPSIDFRADRNSNGTLASLLVSGHASNPKISFTSTPRLPQDEVLAILLFGINRASLSTTQLAELAAAVAQIGGGSSFDPLGMTRNALGLDQLTIGGGSSVGNGGTNVEAGKYVMKGVYVGARQGLSGKSSSQAEVRVDLTKHLKLNTTVGTGGQVTGFTTPENDPGSSIGLSYGTDY